MRKLKKSVLGIVLSFSMAATMFGNMTYVAKAADVDGSTQEAVIIDGDEEMAAGSVSAGEDAESTTENTVTDGEEETSSKIAANDESDASSDVAVSTNESSEDDVKSGSLGTALKWSFEDGTLTISGSGEIPDYSDEEVPDWNEFKEKITALVIGDGVTGIGKRAFRGCTGISEVSIPGSVKEIGAEAFYGCTDLENISFSEGLTDVYRNAFANCSALEAVTLPKSVQYVRSYAFDKDTVVKCGNAKLAAYGTNGYRELEEISVTGTKKYDYAYQVLSIVNEERAKVGAPALKMNSELMSAAMTRATEISVLYSHTRPDGSSYVSISDMVRAENYACAFTSAEKLMTAFMDSAGNKTNIINSSYNVVGIGCVEVNGIYYWVQCFGKSDDADDCAQLANRTESQTVKLAAEAFAKASSTSGSSANETADYSYTLKLDVPSSNLKIGSSVKAAAYIINPGNDKINTKLDANSINWSSSNTNVATVDATGKITVKSSGTTVITVTTKGGYYKVSSTLTVPVEIPAVSVSYRTHIQNIGWESALKTNGTVSGTSGQGLRLEGINIYVTGNDDLGIQYTTHCQDYGWLPWSADGDMSGTEGEAKRLEAIKIQLTGTDKDKYDVYYRVHAQNYGWLGWSKNGAAAGTSGYGYRLEAIQIVVVEKGATFDTNVGGVKSVSAVSYATRGSSSTDVSGAAATNVTYRTHVQNQGWQAWKYNGSFSGTSGLGLRLEGINLKLTNKQYSGGITYRTHIQNIGWESSWKSNGEMSGTSGRGLRLEAIQIQLTGEMAEHYDVYYRVHAQNFGWLGWVKNGASSGTAGYGYRLEGIQVVLVPKGSSAPSATYNGVTGTNQQGFVQK